MFSYSESSSKSHEPVTKFNPTVQLGSWKGWHCLLSNSQDEEEAPDQSHTSNCYMIEGSSHVGVHIRSY